MMSSFTRPQVVPNLYECRCSAEHKGRYSEECGKQSSSGAPLTSIVFFFLLWKSMMPQNSLVTNFLQNIFLCVQQTKKFIQVWNYLRVSKWWQHFHFWVNYPFKIHKQSWGKHLKMFKGLVHTKMKILSLITHLHVVTNLQDHRSSSEHKLRYFL